MPPMTAWLEMSAKHVRLECPTVCNFDALELREFPGNGYDFKLTTRPEDGGATSRPIGKSIDHKSI